MGNLQLLTNFLLCWSRIPLHSDSCLCKALSTIFNFIMSGGSTCDDCLSYTTAQMLFLVSCTQLSQLLYDWSGSWEVTGPWQNCLIGLGRANSHLGSWRGRWTRWGLFTPRQPLVIALKALVFFNGLLPHQVHEHCSCVVLWLYTFTEECGDSVLNWVHILIGRGTWIGLVRAKWWLIWISSILLPGCIPPIDH